MKYVEALKSSYGKLKELHRGRLTKSGYVAWCFFDFPAYNDTKVLLDFLVPVLDVLKNINVEGHYSMTGKVINAEAVAQIGFFASHCDEMKEANWLIWSDWHDIEFLGIYGESKIEWMEFIDDLSGFIEEDLKYLKESIDYDGANAQRLKDADDGNGYCKCCGQPLPNEDDEDNN